MATAQREVKIVNRYGLHARPAMQLVETANGFSSKVEITNRSLTVDAKSIMSVMRLGAAQGIVLTIRAEGDDAEQDEMTLRGSSEVVNEALKKELLSRLDKAGVVIEEARLTHLAYAPEIAQAMLRRQQAQAVIAARKKIVQGAVSMVEMALAELSSKEIIQLDEERKAAMVGNLLVVLCGDNQAEPIINTGTLYH